MGGLCTREVIDFDSEAHFEVCRIIGKGAFGKVIIVQHKKSKIEYALKYINKAKCIKQKMAVHVVRERNLLEELYSPFICNLKYAFQDDINLLMVLDLKLGGDIRFHLDCVRTFKESRAKFYTMEIILALEYLHSVNIIHRDLKPENNANGHAALTDFNVACKYSRDMYLKASKGVLSVGNSRRDSAVMEKVLTSMAGTPPYMAPEMVARQLYDESVDWWSLGIVLYEMLVGVTPFYAEHLNDIYKAILNEPLTFHKGKRTAESRAFIVGLLERNPLARLGHRDNGAEDKIKKHEWFEGVDWAAAAEMRIPVPFVPSDNLNCDPALILNEVFNDPGMGLSSKPVNEKKPEKEINSSTGDLAVMSKSDKQMKMMRDEFQVYDFSKIPVKKASMQAETVSSGVGASNKRGSVLKKRMSIAQANFGLGTDVVRQQRKSLTGGKDPGPVDNGESEVSVNQFADVSEVIVISQFADVEPPTPKLPPSSPGKLVADATKIMKDSISEGVSDS